jgi:hypothetical protein
MPVRPSTRSVRETPARSRSPAHGRERSRGCPSRGPRPERGRPACAATRLAAGAPARRRSEAVLARAEDQKRRAQPGGGIHVARNQPTFAFTPAAFVPQRRLSGGRLPPFASSALVVLPQPLTSATARKSNAAAVPLNAVGGCCSGRSRGARRRGGSDPRRRRAPRGGSGRRARRPVLRRGRGRAAGRARAASRVRRR